MKVGSTTRKLTSHRLEEAGSEYLRATDLFEKLGAMRDMGRCRRRLWAIQETVNSPVASGQSGFDCELLPASGVVPCAH